MIKLSDMLIATLDDKDPLIALQINEAKRLESLETPRVEAERTPIVDDEGDGLYVVWSNGKCIDWASTRGNAKAFADKQSQKTGRPHTVCQVMAPVNGECPTIPVGTFTPERPHEWVIYRDINGYPSHWFSINGEGDEYWGASPTHKDCQRFATAAEAQDYIDENDITGAYPWAVPKLTS